ncbi:hypothetical protein QUF80_05290, partial [Desulfococcaceae bacterium HSG8]|nr:hypothetical protein [Desulfococcaceae bacterium HSG8]
MTNPRIRGGSDLPIRTEQKRAAVAEMTHRGRKGPPATESASAASGGLTNPPHTRGFGFAKRPSS